LKGKSDNTKKINRELKKDSILFQRKINQTKFFLGERFQKPSSCRAHRYDVKKETENSKINENCAENIQINNLKDLSNDCKKIFIDS
jgi:uncharacterized protein YaaW (UPF0174 family)